MKQQFIFKAFNNDFASTALIAGIDEAGRGPLAGAVFAAAVILNSGKIHGLNDSKKLSEKQRINLEFIIKEKALAWSIAQASVEEIDELNILQATMLAMTRAWQQLSQRPDITLIDGNQVPLNIKASTQECRAVVQGDSKIAAIAAASILAKTARDADLMQLHEQYPQYGFDSHKGYGTKLHLARLQQFGPCPAHRRSFKPVNDLLFAGSYNKISNF